MKALRAYFVPQEALHGMIEAKLRDLEPSENDKFECSPGRKRKQLEGRPNVNCTHEENP